MALIQCVDCKKDISDRAASCLHCGAPSINKVVTVQQTAKKYKGVQALGAMVAIAGMITMIGGEGTTGAFMLVFGFAIFLGARLGAWWGHG